MRASLIDVIGVGLESSRACLPAPGFPHLSPRPRFVSARCDVYAGYSYVIFSTRMVGASETARLNSEDRASPASIQ